MAFVQRKSYRSIVAFSVLLALNACRHSTETALIPNGSTLIRFGPDAASSCAIPNLRPDEIRDLRWDQISRNIFALRSEKDGVKLSVYSEDGRLVNETKFGDGALADSRLARIDGSVSFALGYQTPDHQDLLTVDQQGKLTARVTIPDGGTVDDFVNPSENHSRQALLQEITLPRNTLMPQDPIRPKGGGVAEPSTDSNWASTFPTLLGHVSRAPVAIRRSGYLVASGTSSMFVARRMGGRWLTAEFGPGVGKALHWQTGDDLQVTSCAVDGENVFFGFEPVSKTGSSYVAKVEFPGHFKFGGVKPGLYAPPLEDVSRGGHYGPH